MSESVAYETVKHRHFIMYDALTRREPYEAYKRFCDVIEDQEFEYPEYEYWYYRFYYKQLDVNHDRSPEPRKPTLCELPNEILEKVTRYLDFQNRIRARKVCKQFRGVVDLKKTHHKLFAINIDNEVIVLKMDVFEIEYSKKHYNSTVRLGSNPRKRVRGDAFEYAFSDLQLYLRSSKIEIDTLNITLRGTAGLSNRLIRLLTSSVQDSKHFNVSSIYIYCNNCANAHRILTTMQPGSLETIQIESANRKGEIRRLIDLDQVKQAKTLTIPSFSSFDATLLSNFYHFNKFNICLECIDERTILQIRQDLPSHPNIEKCRLHTKQPMNLEEIGKALGAITDGPQTGFEWSWTLDNGELINISFELNCVSFIKEKKKKRINFSRTFSDSD